MSVCKGIGHMRSDHAAVVAEQAGRPRPPYVPYRPPAAPGAAASPREAARGRPMVRGRGRARGRGRSGFARVGRGRFGRGRGRGSPARAAGETDESDYEEDAWDGDEEDGYYDEEEGVEYEEEEDQGHVEVTEPASGVSVNEIEVTFDRIQCTSLMKILSSLTLSRVSRFV